MTTHLYVLHSEYSAHTIIDTLGRAAYHLRREGYGVEDARAAQILESIMISGPGPVELKVVNILQDAITKAKEGQ